MKTVHPPQGKVIYLHASAWTPQVPGESWQALGSADPFSDLRGVSVRTLFSPNSLYVSYQAPDQIQRLTAVKHSPGQLP